MAYLQQPVVLWYGVTTAKYYAFPLGLRDPWYGTAVPGVDDPSWLFKGIWPAGMAVTNIRPDAADRVICTLGGKDIITARLAVNPLAAP